MAVLQTIRSLFVPVSPAEPESIVPAPPTDYEVRPLTADQVKELVRLNVRCFTNGDSYTKHTFGYLLNEPNTLSYRMTTAEGEIAGFVFVMVNQNGAAHLTTIGVAPEHRRRGIAWRLLSHVEGALRNRKIGTLMLEVRVGNTAAQDLYRRAGYRVVQRINRYYTNGEDCFLMIKTLD
jgi:ribosomal-protein-alanine N-acetyltransferase